MGAWKIMCDILQQPSIWGIMCELSILMAPLWGAVVIGILVGWVWKPKWVCQVTDTMESSVAKGKSSEPPLQAKASLKLQIPNFAPRDGQISEDVASSSGSSGFEKEELNSILSDKDFEELHRLYEEKDGGPSWIEMMNRSTATMTYQAWRRDQTNGPPQYRSKTVFEDCDPETMRDFFWDDEFRSKWDDMLIHSETLEACPANGSFIVKWVRKFPFFCSDREYIIGRRIWESERSFFCVTKSVPNAVPRRDKPRRVDLYYSSWCIRAVESRRGDGRTTACEVVLFHYEDMGIPWEIAKLGVRQGMWGAVKKIEPGLRAYQRVRSLGAPLSRCAALARLATAVSKVNFSDSESGSGAGPILSERPANNVPKLILIGGIIAFVCSIDRGLFPKALVFGLGRRFGNVAKRL